MNERIDTMRANFGEHFKLTIFGESHGPAIGVVIDGLPSGMPLDEEAIARHMARRAPGSDPTATARREADQVKILSGLFEGRTTGAPLCGVIENTNTRSGDYANLRDIPRPGHADYTAQVKFGGHQDVSGGGHFSGRLTAPLCIAGGICLQLLERRGVTVGAHLLQVGAARDEAYDPVRLTPQTLRLAASREFLVLDEAAGERMLAEILQAKAELDSIGGLIECAASGVPAGLGDPMFDGMENRIARLAFAIPAVKGISFGAGFEAACLRGSQNNDAYHIEGGRVSTITNHAGGILGGITSGMPLIFCAAIKPTPSIAQAQRSISFSRKENATLEVQGRHDPCIAPRAVPCMEAVMAIALLDAMLEPKFR